MKAATRTMTALLMLVPASAGAGQASALPDPGHDTHGHGTHQQVSRPDDHSTHGQEASLPASIPVPTDADRAAAFPDVAGHAVHDDATYAFVLLDRLEWQSGGEHGVHWNSTGWIGKARDRLWIRSEGDADGGRLRSGQAHALYGRAITRWWDLVAGVRQDVAPGAARTWGAIGIQGLAPYWFEVEATAYVGTSGRVHARVETEYELLVTNRLVLQPLVELEVHGQSDPARGTGAGLSSVEAGLRLRYELRRELAPYLGVTWNRRFFGTAEYAAAAGGPVRDARLAFGLRLWR